MLKWLREGKSYFATEDRTQRHTLGLRDVAYIIVARQVLRPDVTEDPAKYRDQFRRRVQDGRCFSIPYLGCREFSAAFAEPHGRDETINVNENIGSMLLDITYTPDGSGRGFPLFWNARLEQGVIQVPRYAEVV